MISAPHAKTNPRIRWILLVLFSFIFIVSACSTGSGNSPTIDPTQEFESALLTVTYGIPTATLTPAPTETPGPTNTPMPPTADPNRTPPALPAVYTSGTLNKVDTPHAYIQDTCEYLKDRWDPNKSAPGTVVMAVMFHSITGGNVTGVDQVSHTDFEYIMRDLHDQGFETVTSQQLVDFLYSNAKIPSRSVILIVDDRKRAENFEINFRPYYEQWGWTVTNAWISVPDPDSLWDEHAELIKEGWVDYQAHGVVHNINITAESTDDFIKSELYGSIERITQHTGRPPVAYIWPGGSFTKRGVDIALEAGYKIGFSINPRGPIMFNWVPQADAIDLGRPSFIPEGPAGNPLMTLPRYWDTDVRYHIDEVRQLGKEAAAQAEQNKSVELEYYDIVCAPKLGPIPTLAP
jgi:hypothetical protein